MTKYIMESPREGLRLEKKTDDEVTKMLLATVGAGLGMRVLDAGAGTGAVARVISDVVGANGSVTALDASEARIQQGQQLAKAIPNLAFHRGDILDSGLPEDQFDLIWCRFVVEYLADPQRGVEALVRLAKPGGKVVLADLDGNSLFHYPMPSRMAEDLDALTRAFQGSLDPYVGRKLYHFAYHAGLTDIRAHVFPYHVYTGSPPPDHLENWKQKLETLATKGAEVLGGEARYQLFTQDFMETLRAPDTFYYSMLIVVEGVRPLE